MVVTSRCFAFARYHASTNLNILIHRATRLTLQPNSDKPETKRNKGLWGQEWNLKTVLSWKLDKFTLFTDFFVGRHSKNLNKHAALIFFAQADNLSKKNPYFGKHLFRKTRTLSSTPLRGWENSWSLCNPRLRLGGLHNRVEFPLSSHGKVFYCLGPVRKKTKNRVYRLQKFENVVVFTNFSFFAPEARKVFHVTKNVIK